MSGFSAVKDFAHGRPESIGVLVANLGTPEAPEPPALRKYLKEFLSDPRVVEVPRVLWWMILNLIILNIGLRQGLDRRRLTAHGAFKGPGRTADRQA